MSTPCPPWCERLQCQESDPRDRYHQTARHLALIVRRVDAMTGLPETLAFDGALVLYTHAAIGHGTWLSIDLGEDGSSLTMSLESAERLQLQLMVALEAARPRP